jgi:hypothetical protein
MTADIPLISNVPHGVPDKTYPLSVLASVLKPKGSFIVINCLAQTCKGTVILGQPRGPKVHMHMCPKSFKAVFISAGFPLKEVTELALYNYSIIFILA